MEAVESQQDAIENDFESDDDAVSSVPTQNRIPPVIDDKDLYIVLEQVHDVLQHTRAAVKFIRNHGVVDAHVRNESGLPGG